MVLADEHTTAVVPARRRPSVVAVTVGIAVVVIVAAGLAVAIYRAGVTAGRSVTTRSGTAYSSGQQATATSDGVAYDIPLGAGSDWFGGGTEHLGATPSCLVPFRQVQLTFATVTYEQDGALQRRVVWVRC